MHVVSLNIVLLGRSDTRCKDVVMSQATSGHLFGKLTEKQTLATQK